jgi:hypothetical protein
LNDTGPKVNVVDPTFKKEPKTTTSINRPDWESPSETEENNGRRKRARKEFKHAEEEGIYLWNVLKERLFRPTVFGGLIGIVNVGLLGMAGYQFYTQPHLRSDRRTIAWTAAGALALFSAEGYAVEAYRETNAGREEERRAREEGAALYKHMEEIVLRPKVFGGLLGAMNLGVIGAISYLAYENWDRPSWDRRTVSAISVGILTLIMGEGYVAKTYRQDDYHRRR